MSEDLSRRAEDANRKLVEALGHVYSVLTGSRPSDGEKWRENGDAVDSASSVKAAVSELEELVDRLRSSYEEYIRHLEHEYSQYKTDAEHREHANTKLLQDYEGENETLADRNQSLKQELKSLQTRCRAAETSLREKEMAVCTLTEQLGAHQVDSQRASASHESRVREVEGKVEEWRWRVREEERERGEKERELEQSREMERNLRSALEECQHQLHNTLQELHKTQQELHSTEATLATTSEELTTVKQQLLPKQEELEALQEKISDRAQQLMELLDRRSGDYSRQVQEEILAQSRAYNELLKALTQTNSTFCSPTSEDSFLPSHSVDMATRLRDFLNPHLLTSHPSLLSPQSHNDIAKTSYQRYLNTFTDFTQRVRVGEFIACPKSRVRVHRLQQWRHHYKEIVLRPPPGLKMDECPLCDVISLIKVVSEKLAVSPTSLLVYTVDRARSGGTTVRLWVLRRALGSTIQYEADTLLADLTLRGHLITFVSLSEPHGTPSPMEQWETAHYRVVGRLEESPMTDVMAGAGGGGGGGGAKMRADSMDMIDLEPMQPSTQLLEGETENVQVNGRSRNVGVARRARFHLKALLGLLCSCCTPGNHSDHNTQYQHLEEDHIDVM